jgi:uncharacterized protein (DUF1697 family)
VTAWVALLRGVNVNGVTVRSVELADLFRELGFERVRTVLASGNVAFETDVAASGREKLKARIEKALRDRFGYDAWILLPTMAELQDIVDGFPFDEKDAGRQPYAIFCIDGATRDEILEEAASFNEDVDPTSSGAGVVYWNPRVGTTVDTPLGKLLGRARFKPSTTSRNLRTLRKIIG